ncbi:MAG: hypothetical protein COX34_00160 [Candidatus Nealsonbacteria bacterium CG23_combo_of_CG06-09_8_20_14_all_36_12]|uniref:Uncharacterized protein n=1 Tax=Candidatus Nealsonbacteria bacterium CG23_combo_of_CG06-09_8_20_14_all_36_12 TaxID=1974718 RepID=A0A2G9Z105_9BACT|nr:MAG: hypothetical protein COX34_00160 [Candidatus Nealsonbacteria bacterium CG23_combo_of_CG06-09_8_20_14_all_36_12]
MPVETLEKPETETLSEEKEPTEEEIAASVQPGKANPLDPDFLLILFLVAIPADILDFVLDTVGLPTIVGKIIGIILDIFTFLIIGIWMYWKGKKFGVSGKLGESLKTMRGEALKRIQSQISKRVGSRVLRRVLLRAVPALFVEFAPGVGVFTSWTLVVISMLF